LSRTIAACGWCRSCRREFCVGRSRRDFAERSTRSPPATGSIVIRAWIDRDAIANALGLGHDQQVLLSQTVGFPKG
jgi:hypothetical protein